jgi:hypothetical protein
MSSLKPFISRKKQYTIGNHNVRKMANMIKHKILSSAIAISKLLMIVCGIERSSEEMNNDCPTPRSFENFRVFLVCFPFFLGLLTLRSVQLHFVTERASHTVILWLANCTCFSSWAMMLPSLWSSTSKSRKPSLTVSRGRMPKARPMFKLSDKAPWVIFGNSEFEPLILVSATIRSNARAQSSTVANLMPTD